MSSAHIFASEVDWYIINHECPENRPEIFYPISETPFRSQSGLKIQYQSTSLLKFFDNTKNWITNIPESLKSKSVRKNQIRDSKKNQNQKIQIPEKTKTKSKSKPKPNPDLWKTKAESKSNEDQKSRSLKNPVVPWKAPANNRNANRPST